MGTGYTRNDTANNIADGNVINAADLDGEFDAIESAFNSSTGHTHDGTSAEGAPIEVVGPTQDVVITASALRPKTDNTVDLGTSALMYKDGFFDGTVTVHSLVVFDDEGTDATIKLDGNYPDGTANVALGLTALDSLDGSSPGGNNIAIGNAALTALTTGSHNIAIGSSAGDALTTGGKNIAIGFEALSTEDGNGESTAIGYQALKTQNAGASGLNVAVGYLAGTAVSTGVKNTLLGAEAGDAINSGGSNVAVGYNALTATTTSSSNTAVGADALKTNITGASNVAVGNTALEVATGSNNTAIGKDAGNLITSGAANTIIGQFDGNQGTLETLDIRTSSNHIVLSDGAGEPRIVVDDSGRVLVGNTSSVQVGAGVHDLQVSGTAASRLSLLRYAAAVSGSNLTLGHTRSATVGTVGTALVDNDTLGQIDFAGDDGADVVTIGARIRALVDGTPSSNNMPADLVFQTFEGGGSLTERMRITSTGNVGINTATPVATLHIADIGSTHPALLISGGSDTEGDFVVPHDENMQIGHWNSSSNTFTSRIHVNTSGNVGINNDSPSADFHILADDGGTSNPHLMVETTDAGTGPGPEIHLYRNSASPAADDGNGIIRFYGEDDAGNKQQYGYIYSQIIDPTDGSESAKLTTAINIGGAMRSVIMAGPTEVAINDGSEDVNFRVESNNDANMFFVDAGNDRIGIGTNSPSEILHVSSSAAAATLLLESTANSASDGPILDLYRNRGANASDNDNIGIIYFSGENDADEKLQYARIDSFIEDASDGTEDGRVTFQVISGGANKQFLGLRSDTGGADGEVVINESQHDINFRIESDSATNLFVADASTHRIGIGTSSPSALLHVTSGTSGDAIVLIEADTDNNDEDDTPILRLSQDGGSTITDIGLVGSTGTYFTNSETNATYINATGNTSIQFATNDTARVKIKNSTGFVGIGTEARAIDEKLHLEHNVSGEDVAVKVQNIHASSGANATLMLQANGNNFSIINFPDADTSNANRTSFETTAGSGYFTFDVGTFDDSLAAMSLHEGSVGFGTDDPASFIPSNLSGGFDVVAKGSGGATFVAARDDNTIAAGNVIGSYLLRSNDASGVKFGGMVGTADDSAGSFHLQFFAGRSSSDDAGAEGALQIQDTNDIKIPNGSLHVGRSDGGVFASVEDNVAVYYDNTNTYVRIQIRAPSSGGDDIFRHQDSGSVKSEIESNGDFLSATGSYTAISDQRLKENIVDASSQWDDIKALQFKKYSMIEDELDAPNMLGVIAQDLQASGMNGLVKTNIIKDHEDNPILDDDGNEQNFLSVKYSILYMKAIKALQEAMERIETLETEQTAIKARLDALET